jgi:hypothetical protein
LAVLRLAAVRFFAVPRLAAVRFLAVPRLAVLRFAAVRFLAVPRFAVLRFAAVFLFAVPRFAVDRLAVERLAAVRFAAVFFFAPDFLAPDLALDFFALDFFAPDFFAEALREEDERDEREELRVPERDEERVAAAMAGATSALSRPDASPMAESPQLMSAAGASDVSLNEPAFDVCDVSPVPLQSSWVINDLLSWIARARFPTTFVSNVQRGRTTSCRTLLKR